MDPMATIYYIKTIWGLRRIYYLRSPEGKERFFFRKPNREIVFI